MTVTIYTGDARSVLATLPDRSVHCVVTSPPYQGLRRYLPAGHADADKEIGAGVSLAGYVASLVEVFQSVRRVLRDDGSVWLNLGDVYLDKQRALAPARVALALQEDGWWLRDEIVWHKPRTTPSSVKDRTVAAHEMLYLLTKSPTYFYDYLAIEEPSKYPGLVRKAGEAFRDLEAVDPNAARKRPGVAREIVVRETRRKRSVWSLSPQPYTSAHFAVMPPLLVEPCILAGCPAGGTVLDPFGGAGTTAVVAERLGRNSILVELNPDYAAMAKKRIIDAGDELTWVDMR